MSGLVHVLEQVGAPGESALLDVAIGALLIENSMQQMAAVAASRWGIRQHEFGVGNYRRQKTARPGKRSRSGPKIHGPQMATLSEQQSPNEAHWLSHQHPPGAWDPQLPTQEFGLLGASQTSTQLANP